MLKLDQKDWKFCFTVEESIYDSTGQYMFLKFHSNEVIEKKGFYFRYHFKGKTLNVLQKKNKGTKI